VTAPANAATALVVAADAVIGERCIRLLGDLGFAPRWAPTTTAALEQFTHAPTHLVVLDLDLPDGSAVPLLRQLRAVRGDVPVVAVAASADLQLACAAGREGAREILPVSADDAVWRAVLERLSPLDADGVAADPERTTLVEATDQLFRRSDRMRRLEEIVRRVAETRSSLLIQGEPGVGKELVARAVHDLSTPGGAWSRMSCVSLPAELLEVELFGHEPEPGAPGAVKTGRLEQARGGTLLLKEIAELPGAVQAKLVRVLDDGEFCRVGGRDLLPAAVRVIGTTSQDLAALVAAGSFRADLHQRLREMSIVIPPLRERREEIEPLAEHFLRRFARAFNRPRPELSRSTMELMLGYGWPGNVRELESLMKRYVVLGDEGHLRAELQSRGRALRLPSATGSPAAADATLTADLRAIARQAAQQAERAVIARVLEEVQWNRAEAARRLRISYKTLLAKLAQADFGRKLRTRSER
jgi:DNA-binding NtrC family response regulator